MGTNASNVVSGLGKSRADVALLAVVGVAIFVTTFDITAIIMIMPRVKQELALDIGGFAWLMDSYSLAFTVFLMTAGVLADRYGRRLGFLIGNIIFLASSLLCVFAGNESVLLIGRTGQGVGSAFMVCAGLAVLGHRFVDASERSRAFAWSGTMAGAAMAVGPAGGGIIADIMGWHWVFFINVPICLFITLGALWAVDESSDPAQRRIDVPGVATLTVFLVSSVWLLLHGPRVGAVEIPVWAALLWVLALGGMFVLTQRYGKQPLLELKLFSSQAFIGLCVVPVALSVAYWSVLIYLPLFLQERLGSSLGETSYLMLAATVPMFVLPMFSARIARGIETGVFFSVGLIVVAVGGFVIATGAQLQSLPVSLCGMAVAGAGTATLNPQMMAKIVGSVQREQAGAASAISVILRQGGFALGIALLGGVLRALSAKGPVALSNVSSYAVLFSVAGIAAVVSAVIVFSLITSKPKGN